MDYVELKSEDGYMVDPSQWSKEYAKWRMTDLEIEITENHWNIVNVFREFIEEKGITPSSRVAQKEAKKRFGVDSKGFYALFPNGPKQVAMVAGGIKPSGC
ncbi:MAG: sulfurtransferase TusE [Gammaproteobacteria bacterium]|nr:MAG: sulfurtransferase TusE [Gammaproteobacteria bacterium]